DGDFPLAPAGRDAGVEALVRTGGIVVVEHEGLGGLVPAVGQAISAQPVKPAPVGLVAFDRRRVYRLEVDVDVEGLCLIDDPENGGNRRTGRAAAVIWSEGQRVHADAGGPRLVRAVGVVP